MKTFKKIAAVLLAASLAGIASAKTIIKVASVAPARSSWDVDQRTISADWARITGGEVELQFMNSDSMGGEG
ncbi:MAG: ABC transporter substrate-binding protein, partial [Treponema sp.]|nr:ABC transporter substrate-binding protein [Treponema sp.]